MRLIRVYTPDQLRVAATARLEGSAAAHVSRVLRLRGGDPVTLFNGDGWEYPGVVAADRGGVVDRITSYNVCYTKLLRHLQWWIKGRAFH